MKPKRVTFHHAMLRFHDGKPVIGYGNIRELLNKDTGKKVAWMDIKLEGEKDPVTVEYLEFLNSANEAKVLIKERKMKEVVRSEGQMTTVNPDPAKISSKREFTPQVVDAEVVTRKYIMTVEVLEGEHIGKVFTLPEDCLNA